MESQYIDIGIDYIDMDLGINVGIHIDIDKIDICAYIDI